MTVLSSGQAFSGSSLSTVTFTTCGPDGWADVGCAKKELEMEIVEGAAIYLEESFFTSAFREYVEDVQRESKGKNKVLPNAKDIALELLGEK